MNKENESTAVRPGESKEAAANHIANIQEDNEAGPLDKTEGRMNNGETGGADKGAEFDGKR